MLNGDSSKSSGAQGQDSHAMKWIKTVQEALTRIGMGNLLVIYFLGIWVGLFPTPYIDQMQLMTENQTAMIDSIKSMKQTLIQHNEGIRDLADTEQARCVNESGDNEAAISNCIFGVRNN